MINLPLESTPKAKEPNVLINQGFSVENWLFSILDSCMSPGDGTNVKVSSKKSWKETKV